MLSIADLEIAVLGVGYVGLPFAAEFWKKVSVAVFNIDQKKNDELKSGQNHTLEVFQKELRQLNQLNYLVNLKNYNIAMLFLSMVNRFFDEMSLHNLRYFLPTQSSLLLIQR